MINLNFDSKVDRNQGYTESRNIAINRDKYSNICLKNLIKVIDDSYSKKDMIPLLLIEKMDRNNRIRMTLDEMSNEFDYPKTGLSTLFTTLKKKDFLKRVKNGEYMINPAISYRGSRMDREDMIEEYHSIGKKEVGI